MTTAERFEDLEVWQRARELTNLIYNLSDSGSFARDYGLRDQIRRAAVSIMSNIAEGFESRTQTLFIDFLGRAKGSSAEVRSQLYISLDHGYITQQEFDQAFDITTICSKQLSRLIHYLETQPNSRRVRENEEYYVVEY